MDIAGRESAKIFHIGMNELSIVEHDGGMSNESDTKEDWNILLKAREKSGGPEPNPEDWECGYCVYRTKCQKEQKQPACGTFNE